MSLEKPLAWTQEAWGRIQHIPAFIRGMVTKAIEAYAVKQGAREITSELVDEAKRFRAETDRFHQP